MIHENIELHNTVELEEASGGGLLRKDKGVG
jgi:hypothetical protein